ncbi:MAG TPA: alpha/beta fold hydrolase [Vicinamibacterales bacterium]|nr:alpha/beta fold hydrolase [Vicinamibacterales bacterium]
MKGIKLMRNQTIPIAFTFFISFMPSAQPVYTTTFYESGKLRIEAYVYRPSGPGPFPVVIYSHGSRKGQEREERPMAFVGAMLAAQGYLVVVPERRGYGKSDGQTFSGEVGTDLGGRMMARFEEEADDVVAAIQYARTIDGADPGRLALIGYSQGGIVSIRVAGRAPEVRALVDQAGGSLTWPRSPELRRRLSEWARALRMPTVCMDAENDATTEAVKTVCDTARAAGAPAEIKIYPAFAPTTNPDNIAPGHLIFSPQGVALWREDVLAFLRAHLT